MPDNPDVAYGASTIAAGIRSRFVDNGNGLTMHVLEAGEPGRPLVLLLHGFPELAYSWRHILLLLAEAGYHVVAPDQRGYGLTTGWDPDYNGDLSSYRMLNLVADAVGLGEALGHDRVDALIGHDFGSPVAAWSALTRPDLFRSVVMMSSPFPGPPSSTAQSSAPVSDIHADLASLDPPRKHYQRYYTTREADGDMRQCPQGVHDFLRAYYHHKSADWPENRPYPLAAWRADEIAKMPRYYVMDMDRTMPETVAAEMPTQREIQACEWLPDEALSVYTEAYERNGFQGGLQWYRCAAGAAGTGDLADHAGKTIDVPAAYIAGSADWGTYQKPGNFERMQAKACTDFRGAHLVDGAGHWVQQERPDEVARLLLAFLDGLKPPA